MRLVRWILAFAFCAGLCAQTPPEVKPDVKPDVAGITLDSKGAPLRKVDLILLPLGTNSVGEPMPSYCVVSGAGGKFEFYGVPPGLYRLMADRAGYLRTRFGARTQAGSGTILDLRPGFPLAGLEVRLPQQATISGKISHDGSNVALALLQEKYQDGRRQLTTVANASAERSGDFFFNKVAPGRYYLYARPLAPSAPDPASDEEIGAPTYYPGTREGGAAEPIVVRGGQNVSIEFAIQKSRTFRVSGSVSGLPPNAGRVTVALRPAAEIPLATTSTGMVAPDGAFQLTRVLPGAYYVFAVVSASLNPSVAIQPINVESDLSGIVLKPEQYPALQGSVKVDGGNTASPRLRFGIASVTGPSFLRLSAQSAVDGSFSIAPAPPGRYRYEALGLPQGAYLKSARYGDKDALPVIDLTQPAPDARLELVISYAGARIEGAILDEDGKPAGGVAALIPDPAQPDQPWLYKTADANESGRFQFEGVRPGKYRLYAWEELESGAQFDPRVTAPYEATSVAIETAEKETKQISVKRIEIDAAPAPRAGGQ